MTFFRKMGSEGILHSENEVSDSSSSDMAHILDLPVELLLSVLSYCELRDTKNLCEACEYLQQLCVRRLASEHPVITDPP
jgi:hypothetical protein